jgi:hypothetical protein
VNPFDLEVHVISNMSWNIDANDRLCPHVLLETSAHHMATPSFFDRGQLMLARPFDKF